MYATDRQADGGQCLMFSLWCGGIMKMCWLLVALRQAAAAGSLCRVTTDAGGDLVQSRRECRGLR